MTSVLLGVDTEADNQWDASARERLTLRNIGELPRLQSLCDEYGVRPTFLATYEVAVDPDCQSILRDLVSTGRCEIGTHHHPWTTPPRAEGHLYPMNLTREHYGEQINELSEAVRQAVGQRPVSYRAGRNGFCGWQVPILESAGYLVESSVDPFFNQRTKGGPSFAGAKLAPYFVSRDDPRRAGNSHLLEIPISSALNRKWPDWLETLYADFTPAYQFRRVLRILRIVRPIWLRPSYSTTEDMLWLAGRLTASKAPLANIIFHSSELLPGASPYNRTLADLESFYGRLRRLLEFLSVRGARGRTFREFRDEWVAGERP